MAISRNDTITVSLFSTMKRKKMKVLQSTPCIFKIPTKVDKNLSCIYFKYILTFLLHRGFTSWLVSLNIRIKRVLSRYMCTYMYIYMCIIYQYALRNAKIELNERPSFMPSNWHWTSINTQFTDHVTAFRRRCLLIIRCLSISWLHACSVAESTGQATLPGLPLALTQDHRCAHSGGWLATGRQVLADSEVERGNGLTIVTEGTQLPISYWRFH